MKIDIEDIVKKIDIGKLVEEHIKKEIYDGIDVQDIIDDALEDEELKASIKEKIVNTVSEFLSSEEGKEYVVGKFKEANFTIEFS